MGLMSQCTQYIRIGHFVDDFPSQSLDWCRNRDFSTNHLADIDKNNHNYKVKNNTKHRNCNRQQRSREITIGLSSVLRPRQHSIGYMGDGFYRSKEDSTNSIKVLKEQIVHRQIKHTISRHEHRTRAGVEFNASQDTL